MKKIYSFLLTVILLPLTTFGQQIENPGFEFWEDAGTVKDEPVDWSSIKTCDNSFIATQAPVTFDQVTDAHSGNYAIKIYNVTAFGIVATGAICNGRFHAEFNLDSSYSYTDTNISNPQWHTVFTERPDSLAGWFKFFPNEDDIAQFKVILHVDDCKLPENGTFDNWVGMAVFLTEPGVTYEDWTRFSVPFEYYNSKTPEFLLCVINSGDSTSAVDGSYLLADDLELIYKNAGLEEHKATENYLTVSGRSITINLANGEILGNLFQIIDINGRVIFSGKLSGPVISDISSGIQEGTYVAVLQSGNKRYVQKIHLGQ